MKNELRQYLARFVEHHENRTSPKDSRFLTAAQKEVYEFFRKIAERNGLTIIRRENIKSEYKSQLLPTDFCYNLANIAPDFETKFLVSHDKGKYEFVDIHWRNNTPLKITWTPRGKNVDTILRCRTFYVGIYWQGNYEWDFGELQKLMS